MRAAALPGQPRSPPGCGDAPHAPPVDGGAARPARFRHALARRDRGRRFAALLLAGRHGRGPAHAHRTLGAPPCGEPARAGAAGRLARGRDPHPQRAVGKAGGRGLAAGGPAPVARHAGRGGGGRAGGGRGRRRHRGGDGGPIPVQALHRAEQLWLAQLREADRAEAFARLWAAKEATANGRARGCRRPTPSPSCRTARAGASPARGRPRSRRAWPGSADGASPRRWRWTPEEASRLARARSLLNFR